MPLRIPGLRGLPVRDVARHTVEEFMEDDMWTYAAALAYSALFALFPFLLFVLAFFSFLDAPAMFEWLMDQAQRFLPGEAQEQVREVIGEVRGQREGGLLSFGMLASIWIASGGVRSTMNALNAAYDVEEGRAWWKRFPLSVAYTLGFGALVVIATVLMVLGPRGTAWVADQAGAGSQVENAMALLRLPIALLLTMAAVTVVYIAGPNVRQRWRLVLPGAVLAVLLWALISVAFQVYVANFGRFSVTYGSVGAVVMLMAYMYVSSLALLLGAELNAVIQRDAPRPGDAEPQEPAGQDEDADGEDRAAAAPGVRRPSPPSRQQGG